ncbi:MAG: hypothetical protein WCP68_15850, partial [Enhydrobacter sp.]
PHVIDAQRRRQPAHAARHDTDHGRADRRAQPARLRRQRQRARDGGQGGKSEAPDRNDVPAQFVGDGADGAGCEQRRL